EPEAAWEHGAHGGRSLGDDRRVRAERWTGDPRSDVTLGVLRGRCHEGPHEGGVALLRRPGLNMVRGHHAREPGRLRLLAEADQLARMELLEHGGVANLRHRRLFSAYRL